MVSASHNPAEDNGLKVLDGAGMKLDDDVEDELEQLIWRSGELGGVGNAGSAGSIDAGALLERYRDHRTAWPRDVGSRRCGSSLDCANGSGQRRRPRDPRGDGRDAWR